jgi:GT2 family glycosyltransferase
MSVVVSTRDRCEQIARAVRSALANDYPRFDVTIIDQSRDGRTEAVVEHYLDDGRLHYLRSSTRGLASARNRGIRAASGELIALIDDDCEPGVDWLRTLSAAFAVDARIGIVFGNVLPAPHDDRAGFVPAYVRSEPALARGLREKGRIEGMGACMGLRRSTWEALGGFDEMLGVGAPFKAADEGDLAIRALRAGYFVFETPEVAVTHYGFRNWSDGRAVIHDYWYGTGAMLAKHLRCGERSLVALLPRLAYRWAWGRSRVAASLGRRPHRALRLAAFGKGVLAGARAPIDRASSLYLSSNGALDPGTARLGSHTHD